MVFGGFLIAQRMKNLKIENCHVSIFGFRRMMIKDLHHYF
jgi:hypothetical protein